MIRRKRHIEPKGGFGERRTWTASQEIGDAAGAHDYCEDCGHKFGKTEKKYSRLWDHDVWCKDCDLKKP